jgi:hypothetical protein
MNNLKNYDEYVNEGFFNWATKRWSEAEQVISFFSLFSLIPWGIFAFGAGHSTVAMIVGLVMALPGFTFASREVFRGVYHELRSIMLLKKTATRYKRIKEFIEKYPDLEERMNRVRRNMIEAVKANNKRDISIAIHEMYDISREISDREKLGDIFNFTPEEKENIKTSVKKKSKIDPYGEETEDDKEWWNKGNKVGKPNE